MGIPNRSGNVLLLSCGSKVAIAKIARDAAQKYGASLLGCDSTHKVPTAHFVDAFESFPTNNTREYLQRVLDYCQNKDVGLLIPTRHTDLASLDSLRTQFESAGVTLALSSSETLKLCLDKWETHQFFQKIGIPTPNTVLHDSPIEYPAIAKHRTGSGSHGLKKVTEGDDLTALGSEWILQEQAIGNEFTINIYIDRTGILTCAIPHHRVIVESGEVAQAITRHIPLLLQHVEIIAENLKGAWGPLNIQAFYDETSDTCQFIEINPRIGGGYPLADAAGGHYLDWLCAEVFVNASLAEKTNWTRNLRMLRYRDAVFSL